MPSIQQVAFSGGLHKALGGGLWKTTRQLNGLVVLTSPALKHRVKSSVLLSCLEEGNLNFGKEAFSVVEERWDFHTLRLSLDWMKRRREITWDKNATGKCYLSAGCAHEISFPPDPFSFWITLHNRDLCLCDLSIWQTVWHFKVKVGLTRCIGATLQSSIPGVGWPLGNSILDWAAIRFDKTGVSHGWRRSCIHNATESADLIA